MGMKSVSQHFCCYVWVGFQMMNNSVELKVEVLSVTSIACNVHNSLLILKIYYPVFPGRYMFLSLSCSHPNSLVFCFPFCYLCSFLLNSNSLDFIISYLCFYLPFPLMDAAYMISFCISDILGFHIISYSLETETVCFYLKSKSI